MRAAALGLALGLALAAGPARADPPPLTRGETVYAPVYSQVWHGNLDSRGKPSLLLLSAMLSVRNTDPAHGITVRSARYYGDDGKLVREFLAAPKALGPLQALDLFVEHKDTTGGSGASFLVEWAADQPVNPPLVETVHTYFFGTQSIVFTTPGRAIRTAGE
ncbi:MAG: DUF3124 domain-containing protein [Dongiaceae bacterium]